MSIKVYKNGQLIEAEDPKSSLSDLDLIDLKKKVAEALAINRQRLLVDFPFTGGIMMRLNLIPTRDCRVRTACTNGTNIYFDIDFYSGLSNDERIFVLGHEVWHVIMRHILRRMNREPFLWNIAIDKEVNRLLSQEGLRGPSNLCWPDDKEKDKSAEEIYEMMKKDLKKQAKQQQQQLSSGGQPQQQNGGGCSGGGKSGQKQNGNQQNGGNSSSSGGRNQSGGNKNGKLEGQFDGHISNDGHDSQEENDVGEGGGDGGVWPTDRWGEVGFDSDYDPGVDKNLGEKIRQAVISEAQKVERSQGHLPSHISRIVEKMQKPEIKWQEVLAQFVTSCFGGKRRWLPPSRRHIYRDIYLQSHRTEKINVNVAIDTSGSCQGDLGKFFSELVSLLNTFGDYDLNLMQCDAEVSSCEHYDRNDEFDFDIKNFKFTGGGGTSFVPVFDYIEKHTLDTDNRCLIYLTDGYGTAPTYPPPYPVLWVLTSDGSNDFCNWGTKIRFKEPRQEDY